MKPLRLAAVLAVVVAVVAGCGGSSAPAGPGAVTLEFVHAALNHDPGTMCKLTADSELAKIKNLGVSCNAAMGIAVSQLSTNDKQGGARAKVEHVSIHGDHAHVVLSDGSSPELVREHGHWHVQTLTS